MTAWLPISSDTLSIACCVIHDCAIKLRYLVETKFYRITTEEKIQGAQLTKIISQVDYLMCVSAHA